MKIQLLFGFVFLITCLGCSGSQKQERKGERIFEVKEGYSLRPGTIAIVPARLENSDLLLAEYLSKSFKDFTSFKVVDFKRVYKLLPKHQDLIASFGTPPTNKINEIVYWLSVENKETIDTFQKKINSKYIFFVWCGGMGSVDAFDNLGGYHGSAYGFMVCGRLIEYKNKKIIGTSYKQFDSDTSKVKARVRTDSENIDALINESSIIIAKEVMKTIKK